MNFFFAITVSLFLQWEPNPETDIGGYKIYVSTQSFSSGGVPFQIIDAGNVTETEVKWLNYNVEYFAVATAYSIAGEESGYSNEVKFTPVHITPPQNLRIK